MEEHRDEAESQHDEQPMLLEVIKNFGMAQGLPKIERTLSSSYVPKHNKVERHDNLMGPPNQAAKDHSEFNTNELAEADEDQMRSNQRKVASLKRRATKIAGSLQELSNHFLQELDRISDEDKQASEEGDHMFIDEGTVNEYFQDIDSVVSAFVEHHTNKTQAPSPKTDKTSTIRSKRAALPDFIKRLTTKEELEKGVHVRRLRDGKTGKIREEKMGKWVFEPDDGTASSLADFNNQQYEPLPGFSESDFDALFRHDPIAGTMMMPSRTYHGEVGGARVSITVERGPDDMEEWFVFYADDEEKGEDYIFYTEQEAKQEALDLAKKVEGGFGMTEIRRKLNKWTPSPYS
jgi:hypothetical protein